MRKLVRDRIAEIIRANGDEAVVYRAGPDEYRQRLRDKLAEEVEEFLGAGDDADALEELADVVEVVHALTRDLGYAVEDLERVRSAKAEARGAFAERVVWTG
ncbi:nucleoside triphosphate pyrophosphohydrolase [Kribbella sp. CA-253562]|uniref:nucleoside triphosphate pyrophosphohydrolase n=1 Tax=Kribbella sp. CA-253562 TaxID=3239942 RepID=UPI003D94FDA2